MRLFEQGYKINYVDTNNRLVGFDHDAQCCEDFGTGVFAYVPENVDDATRIDPDTLENYAFADHEPVAFDGCKHPDSGGALAFLIQGDGEPDLYVCIWNFHNGYYAHGFEYWNGDGDL